MNVPLRLSVPGLAVVAGLLLAGCERPPMEAEQIGYRGTGMARIENPHIAEDLQRVNQAPEPSPPAPAAGPPASQAYQNVQVLGDLSVAQFTRLMAAITEWVSPEQGCNYCHESNNLASDALYTKVVSRRMLQMTQHINTEWKSHVADTGVTCYTCHRGQPVPSYIWFEDPSRPQARGMAASRRGQNLGSASVGYASLPYDPFTSLIGGDDEIRVLPAAALPLRGQSGATIQQTEQTYGLMMHFSNSLGVNCTFCHNSRNFHVWDQSPPQRDVAWYGIRMARTLNREYLDPLQPVYPEHRLGPRGDAPKLNCSTCHQGIPKPLYGAAMVQDYPSLGAAPEMDEAGADDTSENGTTTE